MKGSADLLFRSAVRGKRRGVRLLIRLDGPVAPPPAGDRSGRAHH
jgi:hypothetical protein